MKKNIVSLFRSLRFRLIAVVVLIEVVMLSLLVWSNILVIQTTHADRLRDTAESIMQQIANTSGNYMVAVDYASLRDYLHNALKHRELSYLVILDRVDSPVVSIGETPAIVPPRVDSHPSKVDDGIYDSSREIQVAGQPMGRVLMGFSLSFMNDAIKKSRRRGIAIAATEIILTVIATVLIGLRITRRLGGLSEAAEAVATGNYAVVVPTETADEVGRTAAAFNRMVGEVSSRTRQLEQTEARATRLLAENRKLVHSSIEVQEEERKHLARELHDELGQCITAIQADAESIHDLSGECDARIKKSSTAIMDVSTHIYDVVHSMMQRLRPGALDDLGLEDALEDEIETWQKRNPRTSATFTASGELAGLGERINISIFRIVQECLTNITRHTSAAHASIDLDNRGGQLELKVRDDGCGMDVTGKTGGLGLIGMRERVEALGGRFLLESRPGKGVSIMVTLPSTNIDNI